MNQQVSLSNLPNELILQIVQDLDIESIGKLCTTSSQYTWICNDHATWKYIFKKEFADDINTDYKQAVMEIYALGRNKREIKSIEEQYLMAAEKGYLKFLVKIDSQQEFKENIQKDALLRAAYNRHPEVIKYLFKKVHVNYDIKFYMMSEK